MDDVRISPRLRIPGAELGISFARSGGPGGQHVNTTSTKVELRFDVDGSPTLSDAQRDAITRELGHRMTAEGVLVLISSEHRSQTRNREAVLARFRGLLAEALLPRRPRRPTRPSRASQRRRRAAKEQRSQVKELRRRPDET